MCFPGIENTLRTGDSFKKRRQKEHHIRSIVGLELLNVDLVTVFPIDYMHCVLLGVMRQMLHCLIKVRKRPFSLKSNAVIAINENLRALRKCMPREFARKQRTFDDIEHWKATEFRMFLSYTGIAAFKGILPDKYYNHFMLLVCSMRILTHKKDCLHNRECANQLLQDFVETFGTLYGEEHISYNVHSLLHIAEDVKIFGHIDGYSAFKFENYMQQLKKMVKKGALPIQQIINRLAEHDNICKTSPSLPYTEIFSLSSEYPNNYCVVENDIIKIEKMHENILQGRTLLNLRDYFEYPIKSSLIGIYYCDTEIYSVILKEYRIVDVINKIVKLTTQDKLLYIPMQHL